MGANVLNRTRFDIMEKMLLFSKKKCSKTRIMQNANISYFQLVRYLDFLLERNLLNSENDNKLTYYKTTRKGLIFLNMINELRNITNPEVETFGNKSIQIVDF